MQRLLELFQIGDHLVGGAEVRLRDNLDKGHTAAVVVCPGLVQPGVVDQLARVLLHVQLVDADGALPLLGTDGHRSVPGDGQVELTDLIGFGQIGVKIVLPVKLAVPGDLAVQGQPSFDRVFQHLCIEYRQRTGHPSAHRAAVGVGVASELGGAGAEDFCLGGQFHMGFQANDSLPGHAGSPPFGIRLW